MKTHGFSDRSIPTYIFNVRLFIEYLVELGITNLADADRKGLADYQLHVSLELYKGKRLAHITQRNRIVCLKSFYRFLVKSAAVISDPTTELELPRVRDQLPPNVLTKKEVARLLAQPNGGTACGIRDRAILELLYSSGIRVSELTALSLEDLDLRGGESFGCSARATRSAWSPLEKWRATTWRSTSSGRGRGWRLPINGPFSCQFVDGASRPPTLLPWCGSTERERASTST